MIPLATIHLGDERQSFDVNALFLDASTVLYAWDSTGDKLVVRCKDISRRLRYARSGCI
jgi:hypothetical protein